jgi:hypothetical protein
MANNYSTYGAELSPNITASFVGVATWPDDIIEYQGNFNYNPFHWTSQALNADGMNVNYLPLKEDVIKGINDAVKALKSGSISIEKSMQLRFLIHFIGDLHQPLHTTDLVNETFPTGDEGGNLFKVRFQNQSRAKLGSKWNITNLHSFWDFAGGRWDKIDNRPYSEQNLSLVLSYAQEWMSLYPRSAFAKDLAEKNVTKWVRNNFIIARDIVYANLTQNGGLITEEYYEQTWPWIQRQVALAGYRLADTLKGVFPHNGQEASFSIKNKLEAFRCSRAE